MAKATNTTKPAAKKAANIPLPTEPAKTIIPVHHTVPVKTKTVAQWLTALKEPQRSKALAKTPKEKLSLEVKSAKAALMIAFYWGPKGSDEREMWTNVHASL